MPSRIEGNGHSDSNNNESHLSASAHISRPDITRSPSSSYLSNYQHHSYPHHRHHRPTSQRLQSFSLIGALEFRNVVNSLQRESGAAALSAFDSPVSPSYAAGHYNFRPSRRSSRDSANLMWDDDVELNRPTSGSSTPQNVGHSPELLSPETLHPSNHHAHFEFPSPTPHQRPINDGEFDSPAITLSIPSPILEADSRSLTPEITHTVNTDANLPSPRSRSPSYTPSISSSTPPQFTKPIETKSKRARWLSLVRGVTHALFPTLVDLRKKSALGMSASILAAPAVFLLTLTLPVVVSDQGRSAHGRGSEVDEGTTLTGHDASFDSHKSINGNGNGNGHDIVLDGSNRAREAEDRVREGHLIDLETSSPSSRPHPHPLHPHHSHHKTHQA